jgi:chorismate mutase
METKTISHIEIERQKINHIDEALVNLLDKRFEVCLAIAVLKKQAGMQVFQARREQEVLTRIAKLSHSQNSKANQTIFRIIMQESKKIQEMILERAI